MLFAPRRVSNDVILEFWAKGYSAGRIAQECSVTRNVVMGAVSRAQRCGLADRRVLSPVRLVNPEKRRAAGKAAAFARWGAPKAKTKPLPPPLRTRAPEGPLPLVELELPSGAVTRWHADNGCTYITGDPTNPTWCNAPVAPPKYEGHVPPWCPFHERVLVRPDPR